MQIVNIEELYRKIESKTICSENDVIRDHFRTINVISCEKCGSFLLPRSNDRFKFKFHCSKCDAKTTRNALKIRNYGMSFIEILYCIYYMALDINLHGIRKLTKLHKNKVYQLHVEMLNLLISKNSRDISKIGGPGDIVEIDECFIGKRKNNVGRINRQKIIFGAISRETRDFRMIIVERRTKAALGDAIQQLVAQGSTVYSDSFSSYFAFFNENFNYSHQAVNHRYNFVNPADGTHTQNIENLWCRFKKFKRRKEYSKVKLLEGYMVEFSMRKRNRLTDFSLFKYLLELIFE